MARLSGLFAATISLVAYILIIGSGSAVAQGASPPPAVSVVAAASRQVTETASFVGRVVAIAFIFGLFPLVIGQGAGAATRHAVGTPVFGGMIAASIFAVFVIPPLFVIAERLRNRTAG